MTDVSRREQSVRTAGATADVVRQHLDQVLQSAAFAGSERLRGFLRYVVEQALAGDTGRLKEYAIGVDVFQRGPNYDPQLDSTVRVHAAKVRDKLREYYLTDGRDSAVRIRLPKGSYVPVFDTAALESAAAAAIRVDQPAEEQSDSSAARYGFSVGRGLLWACAGAVGAAALAFAITLASGTLPGRRPIQQNRVQFAVYPPTGWEFRGTPQVSPDGRRVVCWITNTEGESSVYLHNLNSGAGRVLSGTAGAEGPAWSRDGNSILLTVGGRLVRLDLTTASESAVVAESPAPWGVDWNTDGTVLLGSNPGPIRRFSMPRQGRATVTPLELGAIANSADPAGARPISQMYPRFLPDGDRFLYFRHQAGESAVYVASLDGKQNKRLMPAEANALFVPDAESHSRGGDLLFVRGGRLLAQHLDLSRLEVRGEPRQVAEGVSVWLYGTAMFSVSGNGVIAFRGDPVNTGQFTWFDRSGTNIGVLGPVAGVNNPVISPDGKRVAYDCVQGSEREVWIADIASGKTVRITFDPEVDHTPVWSPDSKEIAFESHRTPQGLYVTPASGGGRETLVVSGGDGPSQWTANGLLMFDGFASEPDQFDIWMFPVRPLGHPRRWLATRARERWPVVSPDGRWLAYASDESGQFNIYVRPFDEGGSSGTGKWQISMSGGTQPSWRADGRELFYVSSGRELMAVAVNAGAAFVYEKPAPVFRQPLREVRGPRNDYATRDGKRFLIRTPAASNSGSPFHVIVNWSNQPD